MTYEMLDGITFLYAGAEPAGEASLGVIKAFSSRNEAEAFVAKYNHRFPHYEIGRAKDMRKYLIEDDEQVFLAKLFQKAAVKGWTK